MNKLIKIKNDYYIVDDSEIKEGDCFIHPNKTIEKASRNLDGRGLDKITHSTQKGIGIQLYLEDIEELVNGYSVENMAEKHSEKHHYAYGEQCVFYQLGFIEGFKAHEELSRDKLFTIEDMEYCYNTAKRRAVMQEAGLEPDLGFKDYINKYHALKTEWEIKFEDNKIILV